MCIYVVTKCTVEAQNGTWFEEASGKLKINTLMMFEEINILYFAFCFKSVCFRPFPGLLFEVRTFLFSEQIINYEHVTYVYIVICIYQWFIAKHARFLLFRKLFCKKPA